MRQRMHSLECYNNIFPKENLFCIHEHLGLFLLVAWGVGFFISICSISVSYMTGHRFFSIAKLSHVACDMKGLAGKHLTCDMKGLAATDLTETFSTRVMSTLLGDWRRSAWLQPAFLLLSHLFWGFHEIILITCCGTKCDQRCLRERSPDFCSLLLSGTSCVRQSPREEISQALSVLL